MTVFSVPARGVGRVDYSSAVEVTVEPVISSWQSNFAFSQVVSVPAAGMLFVDIPIAAGHVVVLNDYFVSIPSNHLVRLQVFKHALMIFNWTDYQAIQRHTPRGNYFTGGLRFRVFNYRPVAEDFMTVGCAGLYTTVEEYTQTIGA